MRGVAPDEVTAETFDKYLGYLVPFSTVGNPRERWHVARRAWNRYVADADGRFPHIPNNEPDGMARAALVAFPESLRAGFADLARAHAQQRSVRQRQVKGPRSSLIRRARR